jgi:hypothetical protein
MPPAHGVHRVELARLAAHVPHHKHRRTQNQHQGARLRVTSGKGVNREPERRPHRAAQSGRPPRGPPGRAQCIEPQRHEEGVDGPSRSARSTRRGCVAP